MDGPGLFRVIVVLVVIGLVAWLITFLPIPQPFMTIIWVVMIVAVILWVLGMALGYTPWRHGP